MNVATATIRQSQDVDATTERPVVASASAGSIRERIPQNELIDSIGRNLHHGHIC